MTGQCEHLKTDGTCCRAAPLPGSARCFFHDPARAGERQEARRRGGRTRSRRPDPGPVEDLPLASVADVVVLLADTINRVRAGRLEARTGNALACLAGQLLHALRDGDLEDRLKKLEEALARQPGGDS
jgi:hypothetical protein